MKVVVWELSSGKEYRRLEMAEEDRSSPCEFDLVFSSDGKVLMVAREGITCWWDLGSGKRIRHLKYPHQKGIENAVPLPPNIRGIKCGGHADSSILFNTFSPGGHYLAVGKSDKAIAVWDVTAGKLLHRLNGSRGTCGCSAVFSGDGKILVTGVDLFGGVRLWDMATGKQLCHLTTGVAGIWGVAISPNRKQVAAAVGLGQFGFFKRKEALYLWDLGAKSGLPRILPAPGVRWVQYSPDGETLAWGCDGESVCLIDRKSGKEIAPRNAHRGGVTSLAYSPDGKRLATASRDVTVRVWEAATGRPLLTLDSHISEVSSVAFSRCGRWLASGGIDGTAILWDASTGVKKRTLKHKGGVSAISFSSDGRSLATNARPLPLWDLATGKVKGRSGDVDGSAGALVFSPDWKFLAAVGEGSIRLYDWVTGKVVWTFEARCGGGAVAFSPDGRTLAALTTDKLILWEVAACRERATLPVGISSSLCSLVFSPDDTLLADCDRCAPAGREVRVWDWAARKELRGVAAGAERVRAVAFSPDGRHLATASEDTTVLIWALSRRGR